MYVWFGRVKIQIKYLQTPLINISSFGPLTFLSFSRVTWLAKFRSGLLRIIYRKNREWCSGSQLLSSYSYFFEKLAQFVNCSITPCTTVCIWFQFNSKAQSKSLSSCVIIFVALDFFLGCLIFWNNLFRLKSFLQLFYEILSQTPQNSINFFEN